MQYKKPRRYKYKKISLHNIEEIEKIFDNIFESTKYCELTKTIVFPDGDDKDEIKINSRKMSFDKEEGEGTKDFNNKIYELPDIKRRLTRSINFDYHDQNYSKKIEIEMINGVGLFDYGSINLNISADDEGFIHQHFQKFDSIIKSFESVDYEIITKIFRKSETLSLTVFTILIWIIISIDSAKIISDFDMTKNVEKGIATVVILLSLLFSMLIVYFLAKKIEKAIPNVDFNFGPENSRANIAAKKAIGWTLTILSGCVAPIIFTYIF